MRVAQSRSRKFYRGPCNVSRADFENGGARPGRRRGVHSERNDVCKNQGYVARLGQRPFEPNLCRRIDSISGRFVFNARRNLLLSSSDGGNRKHQRQDDEVDRHLVSSPSGSGFGCVTNGSTNFLPDQLKNRCWSRSATDRVASSASRLKRKWLSCRTRNWEGEETA